MANGRNRIGFVDDNPTTLAKVSHPTYSVLRTLLVILCLVLPVGAQTEDGPSSSEVVHPVEIEIEPVTDSAAESTEDVEGPAGWKERFNHLRRTGEVSPGNLPQVPANLKDDYFRLLNGNLWLNPGGFVELDAYLDQGDPVGLFAFTPSKIGTVPPEENRRFLELGPDARLSLRRTRLSLDAYLPRPAIWQGTRFYLEVDFFGKDGAPRLRHAYVALPYLIVGRTNSAFKDPDAEPETVDISGPNSIFGSRQQGVRVIVPFGDHRLSLGAENPGGIITPNGFELEDDGLRNSVDLAGNFRANQEWGHLQVSGVYRNIKLEDFPGQQNSFKGWGLGLSGKKQIGEKDAFVFEAVMGDGVGRYISDLSGTTSEVGYDAAGVLGTQFAHGAYLGYQYHWTESTRSTFYGGYAQVNLREGQPSDSYRRGTKLALNVMHDLSEQDRVGLEFMLGQRENFDGQTMSANRLQFLFRHSF